MGLRHFCDSIGVEGGFGRERGAGGWKGRASGEVPAEEARGGGGEEKWGSEVRWGGV